MHTELTNKTSSANFINIGGRAESIDYLVVLFFALTPSSLAIYALAFVCDKGSAASCTLTTARKLSGAAVC